MNNMFDITGKVAVVTGGSGVLGSNIAEGLLKAGAKVIIIGAHQDRVDAALERLKAVSQDVAGTVCNVLDIESLRSVPSFCKRYCTFKMGSCGLPYQCCRW